MIALIGGICGRSSTTANFTNVEVQLELLVPFGRNSFIGGLLGDGNNNTVSVSNCANTISGKIYSDNILGGVVGRFYNQLSMTGIVTIF